MRPTSLLNSVMSFYKIPFNKPGVVGKESVYMADAIEKGKIGGDGTFTQKCSELLERRLGAQKALLTPSGTHALELAALLLEIKPGDEVIVPSFTFVSTVNAFVLRGARPVFIDVRPDTLNIDESLLSSLITPRTRAIVAVHYAGIGCEMDTIMKIAERYGVEVVEDNAHGLCGKYKDKYLGTFGPFSSQSFHETKNITCGEGGALLINDRRYVERAEILREKGTNRSSFFRGTVDKYSWMDIGSSYLLSDLLAAFLYAQLEEVDQIQARRRRIWMYYSDQLHSWAKEHNVSLPYVPSHCEQSYHMFYLRMPSGSERQSLIDHLKQFGVQSVFHYVPLHLSNMGARFGNKKGDYPQTEAVSEQLIRLPFYNDLSEAEQSEVVAAIKCWKN